MTTHPKLKVQLVRSPIGTQQSHRATVRGLGLRRMTGTRVLEDTPAVRGMINKVRATLNALGRLNTPSEIAAKRGKSVEELFV